MSTYQDAFNRGLDQGIEALNNAEERVRFIARAFIDQEKDESPYNHPRAKESFHTLALGLMEGLPSLGPYELFERKEFDATSDKAFKKNLTIQTIATSGDPFRCAVIATVSLISQCKHSGEFSMEYRTEGAQPFATGVAQNQFALNTNAHKVDILTPAHCLRVIHSTHTYEELDKALQHLATLLTITIRGKERELARKLAMKP